MSPKTLLLWCCAWGIYEVVCLHFGVGNRTIHKIALGVQLCAAAFCSYLLLR